MPSFLPLPGIDSTPEECTCNMDEGEQYIIRKPWMKSGEKQPSELTCFNRNYKDEWSLKLEGQIKDRRILCFYHAEHFSDQSVEQIQSFTDVEELQLQLGCDFDPHSTLGGTPDYFLKLPNTTIKSLTLDTTVDYLPFPEVLNFICSFPNLEDLRIGDNIVASPPSEGWDWQKISQSLPLRELTGTFVSEGDTGNFIREVVKLETFCRFEEIVQRRETNSSTNGMNDLVKECSTTLKRIRIHGGRS